MRRLFPALGLGLMLASAAVAAPAERWLTLDLRGADHGAVAVNLNSVKPTETKGVTSADVLVVDDVGSWLVTYEADCRKDKLHMAERSVVDRRTGKVEGVTKLDAAWSKPAAPAFQQLFGIVCRHETVGGTLIADRRSLMWYLTQPVPQPPETAPGPKKTAPDL